MVELWATGVGSLSVYYSIDEGVTWNEISNSPITLPSEMPLMSSPLMLYFDDISTKVRIRFRNSSSESVAVKQFIIHYPKVGERK